MKIEKIDDIYGILSNNIHKKRLVVAFANDSHSIKAVYKAVEAGYVTGTLVGDSEVIREICRECGYDPDRFKIIHEPNDAKGAERAVALVREGEADILMKGLVSTDKYMRAILNKEKGLVTPNAILSHVVVMQLENYHKLLVVSDVAVIPLPDLTQKTAMIRYVAETARVLGVERPKVALIAPTEQVLPKIQSTVDAAILSKMGERGQLTDAFIEGPMALDVAIERESAEIKGVRSVVAGDADGLVFPNLEAGNVFYKTSTKFCKSKQGCVLMGAMVPCVLSSRGDDVETKLNSIALAALLAR